MEYRVLRVVESVNPAQLRASLDCCRGHIIESLCGHQVIIDGKKLRSDILSEQHAERRGVLLCKPYPGALGHREQIALASRRDFSGGHVPCSHQKRCR